VSLIPTNDYSSSKREISTPQGQVVIEGPADKSYLTSLLADSRLSNFRSPARQKEALMAIADSPKGMVYIARHGKTIVGYTVFHTPSPYTRWSRHPRILELGALEVSIQWRRAGIAAALLQEAFKNSVFEEYIVIVCEFEQHWDLQGNKMNVWNYQRMLTKLYSRVGFKKRRTDDPDIIEQPGNMLLVRFGNKVKRAYIKAFDDLTYKQSLIE